MLMWLVELWLRLAPPPCSASGLEAQAREQYAMGLQHQALVTFERSAKCAPSDRVHFMIVMIACRANDMARAKVYYKKLPPALQTKVAPYCQRCGPPPDDDPGMPC